MENEFRCDGIGRESTNRPAFVDFVSAQSSDRISAY